MDELRELICTSWPDQCARAASVWNKFGLKGILFFAPALFLLWIKPSPSRIMLAWHIVRARIRRLHIPKAQRYIVSIAVADLSGDATASHKTIIWHALQTVDGIEVLNIPRVISTIGKRSTAALESAHNNARQLLRRVGADILIWGDVLSDAARTTYALHWTLSSERVKTRSADRYGPTHDLDLPTLRSDVAKYLRLLAESSHAELQTLKFHPTALKAQAFVEKARQLLRAAPTEWTAPETVRLRLLLAHTLSQFGQSTGRREPLAEAIEIYNDLLAKCEQHDFKADWAEVQHGLGVALERLSIHETDAGALDQAISAFRRALEFRTLRATPIEWAETQHCLGRVLGKRGERSGDVLLLFQAIEAYDEALRVRTQSQAPHEWAATQGNIAIMFCELGKRRSSEAHLENARDLSLSCLSTVQRESAPILWANLQQNLAAILLSLGQLQPREGLLTNAMRACYAALEELDSELTPLEWANTQSVLGAIYWTLGRQEGERAYLWRAAEAFTRATSLYEDTAAPRIAAASQSNLAAVLLSFVKSEPNKELAYQCSKQAEAAVRKALEVMTPTGEPIAWGRAMLNLGAALTNRTELTEDVQYAERAGDVQREALRVVTPESSLELWMRLQRQSSYTLSVIGQLQNDLELLYKATQDLEVALQSYPGGSSLPDRAAFYRDIGKIYGRAAERSRSSTDFSKATDALQKSIDADADETSRISCAESHILLAETYLLQFDVTHDVSLLDVAEKAYRSAYQIYVQDPGYTAWTARAQNGFELVQSKRRRS